MPFTHPHALCTRKCAQLAWTIMDPSRFSKPGLFITRGTGIFCVSIAVREKVLDEARRWERSRAHFMAICCKKSSRKNRGGCGSNYSRCESRSGLRSAAPPRMLVLCSQESEAQRSLEGLSSGKWASWRADYQAFIAWLRAHDIYVAAAIAATERALCTEYVSWAQSCTPA